MAFAPRNQHPTTRRQRDLPRAGAGADAEDKAPPGARNNQACSSAPPRAARAGPARAATSPQNQRHAELADDDENTERTFWSTTEAHAAAAGAAGLEDTIPAEADVVQGRRTDLDRSAGELSQWPLPSN